MTERIHEHDEDLPPLNLSPEMEEVLGDMAEEQGFAIEPVKLRARRLLKLLDEQEHPAHE